MHGNNLQLKQLTCDSGSIMPFLITWSWVLLILLIIISLPFNDGGIWNNELNNPDKRL